MKISLTTLRFLNEKYHAAGDPAPHGVPALIENIGAQLGAIEEIVEFGAKYEAVLIAKVVRCAPLENSDHLNVCAIDDGGRAEGIERSEDGLITVVCGAPNVREGLLVAWLPPGATVPETYGTAEPFVLSARPMRGVVSNGMLASPRELAFGDSHDGILEIVVEPTEQVRPGMSLADAYHLHGDVIIDIENKMFTHRPDCFGYLGVARELAGIQNQPYKSPEWYALAPEFPEVESDELRLEVQNELPELVPRFMAACLRNVQVGPSPTWLLIDLAKAGIRSINNIVDYTNWFMLQTGQPLHAYDYDKVIAQDAGADHATLVVRNPRPGEKILLLNGKEIEPRPEAIMIATRDKLIGVGGVMGGGDTEVDATTTNIILECATFDMYSIRRTSMAHGLFTDAVTRNTKGQSPLQNAAVLGKIIEKIRRSAGGKLASPIIDNDHLPDGVRARGALHLSITLTARFINARLGLQLLAAEMQQLLENVEFNVTVDGEQLTVQAPFWRTDIEIREDIVEEVGRLYGYEHLPLVLPTRQIAPPAKDPLLAIKSSVRRILAAAGANELLTYNFVHGNLLDKVGQPRDVAFRLSNALSPDLQYYRVSLVPNLLDKVHSNSKAGHESFALFEMGTAHSTQQMSSEDSLPRESVRLSLVVAKTEKQVIKGEGAAFYDAREYVAFLSGKLGLRFTCVPLTPENLPTDYALLAKPFDFKRSALVCVAETKTPLGIVGEFTTSVRRQLKLPSHTAGFEIDLAALLAATQTVPPNYVALPRFPKVEQDICLRLPRDISYQSLFDLVWARVSDRRPDQTLVALSPIDIYRRDGDDAQQQITLRVSITSYERTLTDDEVARLLDDVAQAAREAFGAERV